MAYTELVKNFNRIRDYLREFYVYGFKSREEYTGKSARSYDDERRRLESWLGDHMKFRRTAEGKTVFLSFDSRLTRHNPLYAAWKAKSFTDGDITLHFLLLDLLAGSDIGLTLNEITAALDEHLQDRSSARIFDPSTIRKKLREYVSEGIVCSEKCGKALCYRLAPDAPLPAAEMLDFFSEVAPCGVVGSYLLDRLPPHPERFAFKHHYLTGVMDSDIVCTLFQAMQEKRSITLESTNRRKDRIRESQVVPLRLFFSVQNGRQYLMAYVPRSRRIISLRTDYILSVKLGEISPDFDLLRGKLNGMQSHLWGVSTQSSSGRRLEHIDFTVQYTPDEDFIPRRLEREKRCGTVERLSPRSSRFSAEVFDAAELMPWVRTFLCRISEFHCSNEAVTDQLRADLRELYEMYDLEGGEDA